MSQLPEGATLNDAMQVMHDACEVLYYGDEGTSLFCAVLVVGCYRSLDPETGIVRNHSGAAMRTRDDMPEASESMLERLREIVADMERRVAQQQAQQRQQSQGLS